MSGANGMKERNGRSGRKEKKHKESTQHMPKEKGRQEKVKAKEKEKEMQEREHQRVAEKEEKEGTREKERDIQEKDNNNDRNNLKRSHLVARLSQERGSSKGSVGSAASRDIAPETARAEEPLPPAQTKGSGRRIPRPRIRWHRP